MERAALGVLDPEGVEGHAVRQGEDLGIDNVGAAHGHGPGDLREKADKVGGVNGDLGDRPVLVHPGIDGKRRARFLRWPDEARLTGVGLGIEGEPVGGMATGEMLFERRRAPIGEFPAERFLRRGHPFFAALGHQPA